jgi:hypothetical protein
MIRLNHLDRGAVSADPGKQIGVSPDFERRAVASDEHLAAQLAGIFVRICLQREGALSEPVCAPEIQAIATHMPTLLKRFTTLSGIYTLITTKSPITF